MNLIEDWLSLSHHKGLNRTLLRHIVEHFSELDRLKEINDARWLATGLNTQGVRRIKRSLCIGPDQKRLSADLHCLEKDATHHLIPINSRQYPNLLAQIEDPPLLIYSVSEDLEKSLHAPTLAIVGSCNASPYGAELATEFAYQLAQRGINSISGMAYGVDAAAHRGSLSSKYATTTAVFGCGVDHIYPRQHTALAAEIAQQGALVSEYCCGTTPRRAHFPQRNRIISGLSYGTLVIEAGARSGSLITAKLALEQSRELFALPGNLHNPLTCGCHRLIQQGAKLVTCIDDIVDEIACFNRLQPPHITPQMRPSIHDSKQRTLLAWLKSLPLTIDVVAEKSGLTTEQVCSMLSTLELSRQVTRDRSGRYHAVATEKSMKENVLDVLTYMFESYFYDEIDTLFNRESMLEELVEVGFDHHDVKHAFDWLADLPSSHEDLALTSPTHQTTRIFDASEHEKLDSECRGYLLKLEQMGIFTPASRELVIDRVMALEADEITIEQLRWVSLIVLYNLANSDIPYSWLEDIVMDLSSSHIH